jgi:plastocyanin
VRSGSARHVLAAVAIVAVAALGAGCGSDSSAPRTADAASGAPVDFDYVVPAGAGRRLDRGERLTILPDELDAKVGQVIRIVNQDDRGHTVGPFFVAAASTLVQRFSSPGTFTGTCSVHPGGTFVLKVIA